MTLHRIFNLIAAILLAAVIAATLATSHLLDADDHRAEWAESSALADAQKQAQRAARQERAAAELCVKIKGPNAGYAWTDDGTLSCTDNRGRSVRVAAAERGTP